MIVKFKVNCFLLDNSDLFIVEDAYIYLDLYYNTCC